MSDSYETLRGHICRETERAVQLQLEHRLQQVWVPKSVIKRTLRTKVFDEVDAPVWWLRKNGM